MITQHDQVVAYLRAHPRLQPHIQAVAVGAWPHPALTWFPTSEEVAAELLADAEFRALGLGTWLGTTDGPIISEAVAQVIPPTYEPVFTLTVDALKLATAEQTTEGRRKAGALALCVVLAGIVIATAARSR